MLTMKVLDSEDLKPGETITGAVYLEIKKPERMKRIQLLLSGTEFTKFSTGSGEHKTTRRGAHTFLSISGNLVVSDLPKDPITYVTLIPPGSYSFPFSLQLPSILPSTMTKKSAWIAYELEAEYVSDSTVLGAVGKFLSLSNDHKAHKIVTLKGKLSPELAQLSNRPSKFFHSKNFFFSTSAAPLKMECEIQYCAVRPGAKLYISVAIRNYSNKSIYELRTKVNSYYRLKAESHTKQIVNSIHEITTRFQPNIEGKHQSDGVLTLQIPANAETIDGEIIRRYYKVELECAVHGFTSNLIVKSPNIAVHHLAPLFDKPPSTAWITKSLEPKIENYASPGTIKPLPDTSNITLDDHYPSKLN